MRALALVVSVGLVAGCAGNVDNLGGGDGGHADAPPGTADAGPPDAFVPVPDAGPYTCLGQPLPTTAPNPISVSGNTFTLTLGGTQALAGTPVALFVGASMIASASANGSGAFTMNVPTNGAPVDGFLRAQSGGYLDTYLYPPAPLAESTTAAQMLLLDSSTFGTLQSLAGVTQQSGKGFVIVLVLDCQGKPVGGATVTAASGSVRYDSGGQPSSNASSTDTDGLAYVFNTTAGNVQVGASVGGMTFRAHTLNARANVITTTVVQP
jgi:hypothetical protein